MNNLPAHITVALTYFWAGLVTVILFGLAIQFQSKERIDLDRRVNLVSLQATACYSAFILYMSLVPTPGGTDALGTAFRTDRPPVWPLAVMEWAVFFSTILWFGAIALVGSRTRDIEKITPFTPR